MVGQPEKKSIFTIRILSMSVLILSFCALQFVVMRMRGTSTSVAVVDSIVFFILGILFLSLINTIQRYYHSNNSLNTANVSTILFFSALTILINYLIVGSIYGEDQVYVDFVSNSIITRSALVVLIYTVIMLFFWIEQQKKQEERLQAFAIEKERETLQLELKSLQQQFKPHFLFNSLNSINALTLTQPEEARRMIHLLSQFMRSSLRSNDVQFATLSEEIEHLKMYTEIEKIRFKDRLEIAYDIDPGLLHLKLPFLILQPIIENAIKYGLYGNIDMVKINIQVKLEDGKLLIQISNPSDANTSSGAKGTGYGLRSIEKKLLILYQQTNLLSVEQSKNTFTTSVLIPQL